MAQLNIENLHGKKLYFASDFHLGAPNWEESKKREKAIVKWLDNCKKDAHTIFLVGDLFDFWYEYKSVVPKGFVRLLGKIAEITDSGIPIHVFTGNHDLWMFNYLQEETGVTIHHQPLSVTCQNHRLLIGHGDGLGPGDRWYKLLKWGIFLNPVLIWAFGRLHPNFAFWIAQSSSKKSRSHNADKDQKFLGENEWLLQYCKTHPEKDQIDFFVFGHRHLPLDLQVSPKTKYVNLGEWINYNSYGEYNGEQLIIKYFEK